MLQILGNSVPKQPTADSRWRLTTTRLATTVALYPHIADLVVCCAALQKDYSRARHWLEKAIEEARQGFGEQDPHVASALNNLAELARLERSYDEAERLYRHVSMRCVQLVAAIIGTSWHGMLFSNSW